MQGEKGPVTILLMPDEAVAEAVPFSDARTRGIILPVGNGSVAILGERDEQLENIQNSILQSVMWST
jgi:hypothetical protein